MKHSVGSPAAMPSSVVMKDKVTKYVTSVMGRPNNQTVMRCKSAGRLGPLACSTFAMPPVATKHCVAAKFRHVPEANVVADTGKLRAHPVKTTGRRASGAGGTDRSDQVAAEVAAGFQCRGSRSAIDSHPPKTRGRMHLVLDAT